MYPILWAVHRGVQQRVALEDFGGGRWAAATAPAGTAGYNYDRVQKHCKQLARDAADVLYAAHCGGIAELKLPFTTDLEPLWVACRRAVPHSSTFVNAEIVLRSL